MSYAYAHTHSIFSSQIVHVTTRKLVVFYSWSTFDRCHGMTSSSLCRSSSKKDPRPSPVSLPSQSPVPQVERHHHTFTTPHSVRTKRKVDFKSKTITFANTWTYTKVFKQSVAVIIDKMSPTNRIQHMHACSHIKRAQ